MTLIYDDYFNVTHLPLVASSLQVLAFCPGPPTLQAVSVVKILAGTVTAFSLIAPDTSAVLAHKNDLAAFASIGPFSRT
jgi:hypothetical protein